MNILIAILTRDGKLDYRVVSQLFTSVLKQRSCNFGLEIFNGYTVDDGRNRVLERIEPFVDAVLWLDDDIVLMDGTLGNMLENLSDKAPIVNWCYKKKRPPFDLVTTGMGCMLVKGEALRKMRDEGFRFQFTVEKGEDQDFIERAEAKGFKTKYMGTEETRVGHLDSFIR